jgi:hypothetical protein
MQTQEVLQPLQVALKYIAAACIDESMIEEAEAIARFLELAKIAPRTVGLVQVWINSQKGLLPEASRQCEELMVEFPEAVEFLPVAAVLRYACKDPRWRTLCAELVESATATPETQRLASSLLDGSFGKAPVGSTDAPAETERAEVAMDYAQMSLYMRA